MQWRDDITEGLGSFHLPSASSLICRLLPLCLLPQDHKIAAAPPGITSKFQAGRKADAAFPDFPSNVAFLGTLYPTILSCSDFVSLLGILLVSLFVGYHLPLL